MLYKLRRQWANSRFGRATVGIFETPPIKLKEAPWTIVSMVSNASYVQMYLLSLKSFYSRLGAGKVTAIVDRNMPTTLRDLLQYHIRGIRLCDIEDIDTGSCQQGGTWERLLFLLDHSRDEYAIQLDCDTLAFGADVSEVRYCAENNIPFTLSNLGNPVVQMDVMGPQSRRDPSDYIGVVAERLFDEYPEAQSLKYVQGSSGFTGFAKNGFTRDQIEDFDRNMRDMLGERWSEWGTEQTASNFAIANSPGAVALPYPKYANFGPECVRTGLAGRKFLHFIGTYRFHDMTYGKLGRKVINELTNGGAVPSEALSGFG